MPPKADTDPPAGISDDQLSLLIRVCERAQSMFAFRDWQDIAMKEGDTAESNRQRFSYMMYKLKAIDDYNNGRETAEFKTAKSTKKRGAKKALSAPSEDDEEEIGEYMPKKPAPKLILRRGAKKAKAGAEED